MCCSVLQCVAVCCSVLQRVSVCRSVLYRAEECCNVLQYATVRCRERESKRASEKNGRTAVRGVESVCVCVSE